MCFFKSQFVAFFPQALHLYHVPIWPFFESRLYHGVTFFARLLLIWKKTHQCNSFVVLVFFWQNFITVILEHRRRLWGSWFVDEDFFSCKGIPSFASFTPSPVTLPIKLLLGRIQGNLDKHSLFQSRGSQQVPKDLLTSLLSCIWVGAGVCLFLEGFGRKDSISKESLCEPQLCLHPQKQGSHHESHCHLSDF